MIHYPHHEVEKARRAMSLGLPADPQALAFILDAGDTDAKHELFETADALAGERSCMKQASAAAVDVIDTASTMDDRLREMTSYLQDAKRLDRDKLVAWLEDLSASVAAVDKLAGAIQDQCAVSD